MFQGKVIDFLKYRLSASLVSAAIILAGAVAFFVRGGLNYGIDFAGGTMIQLRFERPVEVQAVRDALRGTRHEEAMIQRFGEANEVLIRTVLVEEMTSESTVPAADQAAAAAKPEAEATGTPAKGKTTIQTEIEGRLHEALADNRFEVRRLEVVGPQVGADLRRSAMLCIIGATIGLLGYMSLRFDFASALGAIVALVHDTSVTIAGFTLLDKEFSIPIVAALLTIIGYSLNDTIVVFDRVRENARPLRGESPERLYNISLTQTLSRTIITNVTVFLVILALFFRGGPVIHDFSFALLIGCVAGTYSTIYIASPVVLLWDGWMSRRRRAGRAVAPARAKRSGATSRQSVGR